MAMGSDASAGGPAIWKFFILTVIREFLSIFGQNSIKIVEICTGLTLFSIFLQKSLFYIDFDRGFGAIIQFTF